MCSSFWDQKTIVSGSLETGPEPEMCVHVTVKGRLSEDLQEKEGGTREKEEIHQNCVLNRDSFNLSSLNLTC